MDLWKKVNTINDARGLLSDDPELSMPAVLTRIAMSAERRGARWLAVFRSTDKNGQVILSRKPPRKPPAKGKKSNEK